MDMLESASQKVYDLILIYGPKLIGAIIVLVIGLWIIKILQKEV